MKVLKYNVGDLVRLEKMVGHYGSGKGCVRKASVRHCIGHIGKVISLYPSSPKGYCYNVEFDIPYKKPNRRGETSRILRFWLMYEELDPMFVG